MLARMRTPSASEEVLTMHSSCGAWRRQLAILDASGGARSPAGLPVFRTRMRHRSSSGAVSALVVPPGRFRRSVLFRGPPVRLRRAGSVRIVCFWTLKAVPGPDVWPRHFKSARVGAA